MGTPHVHLGDPDFQDVIWFDVTVYPHLVEGEMDLAHSHGTIAIDDHEIFHHKVLGTFDSETIANATKAAFAERLRDVLK